MEIVITNNGHDSIQAHAANCADLVRGKARPAMVEARGGSRWDLVATTVQEVIEDVYGDMIGEDGNWRDYLAEVAIMPCASRLV